MTFKDVLVKSAHRFFRLSVAGIVILVVFGGRSDVSARQTETTSVYVVKAGDTLYDLAFRLGMTAEALAGMNDGEQDLLESGDTLFIPLEKLARNYTVRSGDTLFQLSNRFSVPVEILRNANSMSGSDLRVGQVLVIPAQGVSDVVAIETLNQDSVLEGFALVYPNVQNSRMLISGIPYDPQRYTISHPDFSMGSIVLVRSLQTGISTFAEVTDRPLNGEERIFDVSEAVGIHLGLDEQTAGRVEIRLIAARPISR